MSNRYRSVLDPEEVGSPDIWGLPQGPTNAFAVEAAAASLHPNYHLWGGNWYELENPVQVQWPLTEFEGISFPLDLGPGESFTLTSVVHNNVFGRSNDVELKELDFSGVVDWVNDPGGVLGGSVVPGTPFSGTWRQDPATPDSSSNPRWGDYPGAIAAWTIDVGGNPFEFNPDGLVRDIHVEDGDEQVTPFPESDFYVQEVDLQPALGLIDGYASLELIDWDGTAFVGDALPEVFVLEEFEHTQLTMLYGSMDILGSIQSISAPRTIPVRAEYDDIGEFVIGFRFSGSQSMVPAPSALVGLISMGVMGLMAFIWRRRRTA